MINDGSYTITIWNSGYEFEAEIQFEPADWEYIDKQQYTEVLLIDV